MSAPDVDEPSPLSSASSKENTLLHPHKASPSPSASARQQPPRKRRRIIISCTECHRRKQKCDRSLPCANCVSRNKQDACRYETGAPTAKAAKAQEQPPPLPLPPSAPAAQEEPKRRARVSKYDVDPRLAAAAAAVAVVTGGSESNAAGGGPVGAAAGFEAARRSSSSTSTTTNFGYAGTGASTLGFLKRIDEGGESLSRLAMGPRDSTAYFGTRERYKSLVRQLPARPYIEKLVDIYFKDFNWQYNVSLRACMGAGESLEKRAEADLHGGAFAFSV